MDWEFQFLLALQNLRNPIMDRIMIALTTLGNYGIFWISIGLILFLHPKHRKNGAEVLVAILLGFILCNLILKNMFLRFRPCQIMTDVELIMEKPFDTSFPSGHTMNAFVSAMSLLYWNRCAGIAAFLTASGIAFSRMYGFMHFPTDVITGAVLGVLTALGTHLLFQKTGWLKPTAPNDTMHYL